MSSGLAAVALMPCGVICSARPALIWAALGATGQVCEALARQGILVRAGSEFRLPGHARVTTGEKALMDDVARRLVALVGA